jgi:hypothetical protein
LKGIYLFAIQKDKCQEKVWPKGVKFRRRLRLCRDKLRGGEKGPIQQKGFFPSSKTRPYLKQSITQKFNSTEKPTKIDNIRTFLKKIAFFLIFFENSLDFLLENK